MDRTLRRSLIQAEEVIARFHRLANELADHVHQPLLQGNEVRVIVHDEASEPGELVELEVTHGVALGGRANTGHLRFVEQLVEQHRPKVRVGAKHGHGIVEAIPVIA